MRSSTAPPVSTTNAIQVEACVHSSATHGTSATAASPMAGTTPSACRWTTTTTPVMSAEESMSAAIHSG